MQEGQKNVAVHNRKARDRFITIVKKIVVPGIEPGTFSV